MKTFFIRTNAPLSDMHRDMFAAHHAEWMGGNQLSIISSVDGSELLIKITCDCENVADIVPVGFAYTDILALEDVRALLDSPGWKAER